MAPTSSARFSDGISTSRLPPASRAITPVIRVIGEITPKPTPNRPPPITRKTRPEMLHRIIVKVPTRWVAAVSVAALSSLVLLTISSIKARCAR